LSASDSANWAENSPLAIRCSLAVCHADSNGLPPSASTTVWVSSPNRRASATEVATASLAKATRVLFTNFSRDPAPTSPTQTVRWANASNRAATRGRAASGPEAKIVNWPCSAGCLLPDTGASSSRTSGRSSRTIAATRSVPATPMVLICAQIPPASAASMPWSRAMDMTVSASVTIVTTTPARPAASAAVAATSAPSPARSWAAAGLRSQTIVGIPARNALIAIPWPIAPMPSTAAQVPSARTGRSWSSRRRCGTTVYRGSIMDTTPAW
jgi:hypothetical protein